MFQFDKIFFSSFVRLPGLLMLVFLSFSAIADVEPTKVLFIGNSYTHMNDMPEIFEKISKSKGVEVEVEMDARSSHTFKMHSNRPELFEHIKAKKWDYVILQGFSRELSHDRSVIDTASVPYISKIIDSIYANNSCTQVLLYMTWGYKEGFKKREEIDTYEKMTDSIKKGYSYISDKFNLPIVPVGYVYKSIRALTDFNLYDKDNMHPNHYGSFVIASSFFSAIFKSSPENSYYKGMNKDEAALLQHTVHNYVINHLEEYKLRDNSFSIMFSWSPNGRLLTECTSDFPEASVVRWEFGDGDSALSSTSKHEYRKIRPYTLSLIVQDACGVRSYQHKLELSQIPPPPPKHPELPKIEKEMTRVKKRKIFG